jgi:VanZ family protein
MKILFWLTLLATLAMALLPHPPVVPGDPSDKFQHAAAFLVLGGLASVAYPRRWIPIVIGLSAFGGLIEILQSIPALHRDPELADWLVDTFAAIAVIAVIRISVSIRQS